MVSVTYEYERISIKKQLTAYIPLSVLSVVEISAALE